MNARSVLLRTWTGLIIAVMSMIMTGCGDAASRHVLVSGGPTGVYYPTSGAIAQLAEKADSGLFIDVQTSGGSVANARLLAANEAGLAMMQNDIAAYAINGELMFEADGAFADLVGVAALYPEHIQIVARPGSEITSVADLAGKAVAIGDRGSGTEANALQILAAYGLSEDDLGAVQRLKASESADYLTDGRVDAAFFTFGIGTSSIVQLAETSGIKLVAVDGEGRSRLMASHSFYREAVIPAGAYTGVETDVPTVSVMATLVARRDAPERLITAVLTGVFDNLEEFQNTHARLRNVSLESAEANLTLPVHPSAAAFYAGR